MNFALKRKIAKCEKRCEKMRKIWTYIESLYNELKDNGAELPEGYDDTFLSFGTFVSEYEARLTIIKMKLDLHSKNLSEFDEDVQSVLNEYDFDEKLERIIAFKEQLDEFWNKYLSGVMGG